jgi:hypothetical protein
MVNPSTRRSFFLPFEARLIFDSPSELHTVAVRNGQVLLVSLQSAR